MFSDDDLMTRFVLKGGNAIDLAYQAGSRASIDIDLSMEDDFSPDELNGIHQKVTKNLQSTFRPEGYEVFDITIEAKPVSVSPELANFWGGYGITFKLIDRQKYIKLSSDMETLRRNAIMIGSKSKFKIDISKFEYCTFKQPYNMDGLRIFVYTPEMLVCEKLRAICQQMPEYNPIVHRERAGSARARDFVDIYTLIDKFKLDILATNNLSLLQHIFIAKKVPLTFLKNISQFREFHRPDFLQVKDTIKTGTTLREFDFYFDFVVALCKQLEIFGNI
jgi:predicted nucleotidyltransferase component of viral defense system